MQQANIGIIVGSNRPTRICRQIAEWVMRQMQREGLNLSLIDLAEINLPFLDEPDIPACGHYVHAHTQAWSELVKRYDGFVLVFPQYNWGYPAVLKNALDFLYDEWAGKPVSIVCYGGRGGFQAALAMKLVTQGLDMVNLASNPPLTIDKTMFDEQGQFKDIDNALARSKVPVRTVATELVDWLGQYS